MGKNPGDWRTICLCSSEWRRVSGNCLASHPPAHPTHRKEGKMERRSRKTRSQVEQEFRSIDRPELGSERHINKHFWSAKLDLRREEERRCQQTRGTRKCVLAAGIVDEDRQTDTQKKKQKKN